MIARNNVYGKKTIKENEILANFQRFDKEDPQQRNGVIDYSISNVQGLSNSLKYDASSVQTLWIGKIIELFRTFVFTSVLISVIEVQD